MIYGTEDGLLPSIPLYNPRVRNMLRYILYNFYTHSDQLCVNTYIDAEQNAKYRILLRGTVSAIIVSNRSTYSKKTPDLKVMEILN